MPLGSDFFQITQEAPMRCSDIKAITAPSAVTIIVDVVKEVS